MTIAVAIKTSSAVVFAADSKVTTSGIVGYEQDGTPRWVEQTYDNATKVVHDRSESLMAMVAGHANIGQIAATDFFSTQEIGSWGSVQEQDQKLATLVSHMVDQKNAYWSTTQIPQENWPGPTMLLAAPSLENSPRVWKVDLNGTPPQTSEVLTSPGIYFEGSYQEVFSLIYGFEPNVLTGITEQLEIEQNRVWEAIGKSKTLRPHDKLSLWAMPLQDAIDLAVFLANVQVEMDRFLPGTPACGGPIDVMVLRMAPKPEILSYPGKILHHPHSRR